MPIEYTDASWNPYTGCLHTLAECPTADMCWAKRMTERFPANYPFWFEPTFYPNRLREPERIKGSSRIGVSFMGDLFGDWATARVAGQPILIWRMFAVRESIVGVVKANPQHTFLFLTKRPENLARWNPWPVNAWVGTTITGGETPERQRTMLEALSKVEGADVKWLSIEPLLPSLASAFFFHPLVVDWLVVGAQSGAEAQSPPVWEIENLEGVSLRHGIPLWEKNNLRKFMGRPLRQELPDENTVLTKAMRGKQAEAFRQKQEVDNGNR